VLPGIGAITQRSAPHETMAKSSVAHARTHQQASYDVVACRPQLYKHLAKPDWWPLPGWNSRAMDRRSDVERVYLELQRMRAQALGMPDDHGRRGPV